MSIVTVEGLKGSAWLSEDGLHRYRLLRKLSFWPGILVWIMLNPSTADADEDDATIRRVIGFSLPLGFGTLIVVNVFAFRATDPAKLCGVEDPVGPENERVVKEQIKAANRVIVGWGGMSNQLYAKQGANRIIKAVQDTGTKLECLGRTASGHPRHPLYLKSNTKLEEWKA